MTTTTPGLTAVRAGLLDYQAAWDEQRRLHESVVAGERGDTVLLLEHPSVYTAGKRTEPWDRPMDGTPVVDVDRGGKITWHGPGQLVGYPILRLPDPVDVVAYVRRTEAAAHRRVRRVRPDRRPGRGAQRGLGARATSAGRTARSPRSASGWPGASPCTASRINCDCDLTYFDRIVPCGIRDAGVTSLTAELGRPVTVADVLPVVERQLSTLLPTAGRDVGPAVPVVDAQGAASRHGVRRCRSRGNAVTSRTLAAPTSRATNRSRPMAKPPCGGMPCRNASR